MKELQERIKKDGIAVNEDILKVDSFINHQVDPVLMQHIGEALRNTSKIRASQRLQPLKVPALLRLL